MGGFLAMQPEDVDESAERIRRTGEQLSAEWGEVKSAIAGLDGAIGGDRLGGAFRQSYRPASDRAQANADTFPPRLTRLAGATSFSVDTYVGMDGDSSGLFPRLGG